MHILLISATTFEIQPTIEFLTQGGGTGDARSPSPLHVETLITGVGSMAATWALTRRIGLQKPDLVLQAGIAGAFNDLPPGSVVTIGEEIAGDLGVWENQGFHTLFDMKFADPDAAPFSGGKLVNPYKKLMALTGLNSVLSSTVNEVTTSPERIRWHQQNTHAIVESMEGASLHYVCLQEKIPFLQLRAVSNAVGVRDKTKWDIRTAIANLNKALISLLVALPDLDKSVLELQ